MSEPMEDRLSEDKPEATSAQWQDVLGIAIFGDGVTEAPVAVTTADIPVAAVRMPSLEGRELCEVWRTDESLWRDVVEKSPHNGRGIMNYGLVFIERGDYASAIANCERAPNTKPRK